MQKHGNTHTHTHTHTHTQTEECCIVAFLAFRKELAHLLALGLYNSKLCNRYIHVHVNAFQSDDEAVYFLLATSFGSQLS